MLQDVQLVRSQIIEVAATRNIRLQTPRQRVAGTVVEVARWHGELYLHIEDLSQRAVVDDLLHLLEVRKIATVIGHKTGHTGHLADAVDAQTILIARRQGLLDIARLMGPHGHDGECGMTRRWRGNIDGVDIRVVDELLGIGIPLADMMTLGIGARLVLVAAHHSLDMRSLHNVESGAGLLLCHLATTYESPTDLFHNILFCKLTKKNAKRKEMHQIISVTQQETDCS